MENKEIKMATKKESKFGVIEGVLVYAKIAQPDYRYQSTDREYSVGVLVDEDTADEWDNTFKKQPAKKIRVGDFENKYKFECPFDGKFVYEIRLKREATRDGVDVGFRPNVFLDENNGDRADITESRLIANGTKGKVSYYISTNDFGTFARLNNILIQEDDFIEYESSGKGAGSEFGESKPVKKEPAKESVTKARPEKDAEEAPKAKPVKPAKASKPVDDDLSDAPF